MTDVRKNYFDTDLLVRNVDRIEGINTRYEERLTATFRSWQICRTMRRDFNFLSSKLFIVCLTKKHKARINQLLMNIHDEAYSLETLMLKHELPTHLPSKAIDFRIVSSECRLLFDSFMLADKAVAKMSESDLRELIDEHLAPFNIAVHRLMKFLKENISQREITSLPSSPSHHLPT